MGKRQREILRREKVSAYRLWNVLGIDQGELSRSFHVTQCVFLKALEG